MKRNDLKDLHYITALKNVASIMEHGILSHERAKRLPHVSVAMEELQDRRKGKRVPAGRPLHEYANLYFCARNPMLYKRQAQHRELCVLRVAASVLEQANVVIADGNAASEYTAFRPSPAGLMQIDALEVFAEYWTDSDPIQGWERKRVKCAELLVPDRIPPDLIIGCFVSCEDTATRVRVIAPDLEVAIDPHLFFQPKET